MHALDVAGLRSHRVRRLSESFGYRLSVRCPREQLRNIAEGLYAMVDLSRDSIINVIHNGIKHSIRVLLENRCFGAAVILLYSGIDTMAYLDIPAGQEDVTRTDFVRWAERYIRFPCAEQLTGLELYGARCGMLHSYSVASNLSRQGRCRQIGYMDKSVPEVRSNPAVATDLVLVSVPGLAEAFFDGVDTFLIDVFSDIKKAPIVEERLRKLVHRVPINRQDSDN